LVGDDEKIVDKEVAYFFWIQTGPVPALSQWVDLQQSDGGKPEKAQIPLGLARLALHRPAFELGQA